LGGAKRNPTLSFELSYNPHSALQVEAQKDYKQGKSKKSG
jgi:hypothetical protein